MGFLTKGQRLKAQEIEIERLRRENETLRKDAERLKWISVNDCMPEKGITVLVCGSHDTPWPAYYATFPRHGDQFADAADDSWITGVTHWMPMLKEPDQ